MKTKLENLPPFEDNIYYLQNPERYLWLLEFYESYPKSFSRMLERIPYAELRRWIDQVTSSRLSDPKYKIPTKVAWILFGIVEFPRCKLCNSNEHYKDLNITPKSLYRPFCSYKCAGASQETKDKSRATFQKNLGVDWPMQSKFIRAKSIESCLRDYGVENPSQIEEVKTRKLATTIENFGEDNKFNRTAARLTIQSFSEDRKEQRRIRSRNTFRKNLGVDWPAQSHEVICKCRAPYYYDGIYFKSSWELAKFIFHKDHGDRFEYQPNIRLEYVDDLGAHHWYHPDFIVGGEIQEVKGDLFFKNLDPTSGQMLCPYRNKDETDEDYEIKCKQYQAKYVCMQENHVRILTREDIKQYLDYVVRKYGKDYLTNLKVSPESKIVNNKCCG